jgi:hypothetical protein
LLGTELIEIFERSNMKSNVFKTMMAGFKTMWCGSRLIFILACFQLIIAAYLVSEGRGTERAVSWYGLGFAVASMAVTQFSFAGRLGIEMNILDLEQKKFETISSRFDEVLEKLENIEDHIINEKRKEG